MNSPDNKILYCRAVAPLLSTHRQHALSVRVALSVRAQFIVPAFVLLSSGLALGATIELIPDVKPLDVSADGSVIVGRELSDRFPFRWTAKDRKVEPLTLTNGAVPYGTARAVSGDGSVVVGSVVGATRYGLQTTASQAFQWTRAGGMKFYEPAFKYDYDGGWTAAHLGLQQCKAVDVSEDGRRVLLNFWVFGSREMDNLFYEETANVWNATDGEGGEYRFCWPVVVRDGFTTSAGRYAVGSAIAGYGFNWCTSISGDGRNVCGFFDEHERPLMGWSYDATKIGIYNREEGPQTNRVVVQTNEVITRSFYSERFEKIYRDILMWESDKEHYLDVSAIHGSGRRLSGFIRDWAQYLHRSFPLSVNWPSEAPFRAYFNGYSGASWHRKGLIPSFSSGRSRGVPMALSRDGTVQVGLCYPWAWSSYESPWYASHNYFRAFLTVEATAGNTGAYETKELGSLHDDGNSAANGVSADGALVVGWSWPKGTTAGERPYDSRAFLWSERFGGIKDLNQLYAKEVSRLGITLVNATAVSADGSTIVGTALGNFGGPVFGFRLFDSTLAGRPSTTTPIQGSRFRISGSGLSSLVYLSAGNLAANLIYERQGDVPVDAGDDKPGWQQDAVLAEWKDSTVAQPEISMVATLPDKQAEQPPEVQLDAGSDILLLANPSASGELYALVDEGGGKLAIYRRQEGFWHRSAPEAIRTDSGTFGFDACLTADALHLVFYNSVNLSPSPQNRVQYARIPLEDLAAATQLETVAQIDSVTTSLEMEDFGGPVEMGSRRARNLGIAAGADGTVHIIYSSGRSKNPIAGGTGVRSDLRMATKPPGGAWTSQELLSPGAGFGDYGGLGASIAMAPGGEIGVAANIIPRAPTGSPGRSYLVFAKFFRGQTPSWQLVDNTAAGYISGDGQQGTGLFPKLAFDAAGRAHIAYTDHASEHLPGQGALSYSGQLRYARQNAPLSGWELFRPVVAGGVAPIDFKIYHPSLAVRSDGTAAVAANVYRWTSGPPSGWQTSFFLQEITPQMQPPPPYVDPSPSTQGKKFKKKKSKPKSKPKAKAKQKKGKKK